MRQRVKPQKVKMIKISFDLNHRKLAIYITNIRQTFLKILNFSLILASIMIGMVSFIAARQGGRIIVDDKGYYYKRTSTNKKTGVSYLRCRDEIA